MRNAILLTLLTSLLLSCNSNNENPQNDAEQKEKQQKIQEEQEERARWNNLNNLAKNFGAVAGFDTLGFSMSYKYQKFLEHNNKIVLDNFRVSDIAKKDTTYIVSFNKGSHPKLFFELTCNEKQVQEMLADSNKIIIAAITSIKKVKLKIETEVENSDDPDEEPDVTMTLRASRNFILKGQLINVLKQ